MTKPPSERDTLPPHEKDEPLPREQEVLLVRFAAIVSRHSEERAADVQKVINSVEGIGKRNDDNYKMINHELRVLKDAYERKNLALQQVMERTAALERWRDREGKRLQDSVDELKRVLEEHFSAQSGK